MKKQTLISSLLILLTAPCFAQSPNLDQAFAHQIQARKLVQEKKWQLARDEADLATKAAPGAQDNRDAWLLLAATEERLDHVMEAKVAYTKYLSLSPAPEKKQLVAARLLETEEKANRYASYMWGSRSAGLLIGFSPLLQSTMKDEISSDMSSSYDVGFRISQFSFGYKRGVGKSGAFQAPTTTKSNSPYSVMAAGSNHVVEELYLQYTFELGEKPETRSVVWGIPLYMAGVSNGTRIPNGKLYSTYGYDFATGVAVDFFTKSVFSFDIAALYHLGIPFGNVQSSEDALPIKNSKGEAVTGSTTGAEIRLGIKFLFGTTPPATN